MLLYLLYDEAITKYFFLFEKWRNIFAKCKHSFQLHNILGKKIEKYMYFLNVAVFLICSNV